MLCDSSMVRRCRTVLAQTSVPRKTVWVSRHGTNCGVRTNQRAENKTTQRMERHKRAWGHHNKTNAFDPDEGGCGLSSGTPSAEVDLRGHIV